MGILLILALSFVPMAIYALFLWWLDRYEKEPLPLLAAAFIWGAIPSIILALIMQVVLDIPIVAFSPNPLMYDLLGASVVAPLTEEGVKALAVLALLLLVRHEIDSPIDGVIYGGVVGFGFAAVENVFYLAGAYTEEGAGAAVALGFMRAVVFGLNHAMFTGFTGLGVALSLEVRNKALKPLIILLGFAVAVGAHAFHNAFSTFWSYTENGGSLLVALIADWAGVLILLLVALWAYFLERKRITAYAELLVKDQKLPQSDVAILKSTRQRHIARLQTLFAGDTQRWWAMQRYHRKLTEAAFAWHRVRGGDNGALERFQRLEREALALRQA